jgi:hypothetical protein
MKPKRLYYFTEAKYGIEAIEKRRIKISSIQTLNDPFELLGPSLKEKAVRENLKKWKQNVSRTHGLICMSESWRHPMMWAHYADKYKGICLGFDVSEDLFKPIEYVVERAKFDELGLSHPASLPELGALNLNDAQRKILLLSKFRDWKYEKEYRAIIPLNSDACESENFLNFYSYLDSKSIYLKEVIIGSESQIKRTAVDTALGDLKPSVRSFLTRPAFKTFKIVEQQIKSMWT